MINAFNRFTQRVPAWFMLVLTGLLIVLIGLADYATGYEISFGLFYLIPVFMASWTANRAVGLAVSMASAATWLVANRFTETGLEVPLLILLWNATTRLGFFGAISLLLNIQRTALARQTALARTDPLTQIPNRLAFIEALQLEIDRSRRYERPFSLLYLDLDGFKQANDRFGHEMGDRILVLIALTIKTNLRSIDTTGRLGGDEFAVLLPEAGLTEALQVAYRVQTAVSASLAVFPVRISSCVGLVACPTAPPDPNKILNEADQLMLEAKKAGPGEIRHKVLHWQAPPTETGTP